MLPSPWFVRAITRVSDTLARLRRRIIPAQFAALELGTAGWVSHALAAFCELGVAGALQAKAQTARELAAAGYGHEASLERLLRSLCAYGVVRCDRSRRYTLGRVGRALTGADSVAAMIRYANAPWHTAAHGRLAGTVREGRSGFSIAHGEPLFSYLQRDREAGALFDEAMHAMSTVYAPAFAAAYDFSHCKTILDVGGGDGTLVEAVRARYPNLRTMVFEAPQVVQRVAADRPDIEFVAGDMLADALPAADVYVLSHVLHDWDDENAAKVLANVRAAMPDDARVLIYELLVQPPSNVWSQDRVSDLEMMAMLGGRERGIDEFAALAAAAGLRVARVIAARTSEAVIECVPAGSPSRLTARCDSATPE
jgi:hypothetical protein